MFYGGMAGAFVTLLVTVIAFMKLNMLQVLQDLTGLRLVRGKESFSSTGVRRNKKTSSQIKVRKKEVAAGVTTELAPTEFLHGQDVLAETMILDDDMGETTILTSLIVEKEEDFKKEIDIVIVHSTIKL